jgi:lysozyme
VNPSQACLDLVKQSEGLRTTAYRDPVGVLTVGWGHTGADVKEGARWSEDECSYALACDLQAAGDAVDALVTVPLTQGQYDALVDFVFNMGAGRLKSSTLLKRLNAGDYAGVPYELYRQDSDGSQHGWIFAGGMVLPGLVTRRKSEIELWGKG